MARQRRPLVSEPNSERLYRAVINDEEQYSIWPDGKELPAGWHDAGKLGTKEECLAHIEQVWTDMRPRSLREAMAKAPSAS